MAASKRKKPSVLRKLAVDINGSDDASSLESSIISQESNKDVPKDPKTACDEAASVISRIASFDRKAKSMLNNVYEELHDMFQCEHFFPEIKDEMTVEFGNILEIIKMNQADVNDDICPIVITGETSAGKSTFINLLLGVELLPQSPLTCTSPICRISNKDFKQIVLTDNDNEQTTLDLSKHDGSAEMKRKLKDYICATKAGEMYKTVDISWPVPCLQNKIMIVDTPGISPDNDTLTERLLDYLPSALAFIYIINPTNAGGIQSDRLERLLDEQAKRISMGVRSVFDPRRAIFVCNKWDQMHEDEEQVFNHIKQKLQEKWTNFDESKVFKISAREEIQRSKDGYIISESFKCLLQGIDKMVPACLQEKIFRHANWQRYFLERLSFKLAARVTNAIRTEDEKRIMAKKVSQRIQKVRKDLNSVQIKLKNVAKDRCRVAAEKLLHHLNHIETLDAIFSHVKEELPETDDPETILSEVTSIIDHQIKQDIKAWLNKTNNDSLASFLSETFTNECSIIETDCKEIDELILGRYLEIDSLSIEQGQHTISDTTFFSQLSKAKKVAIFASIPLWAPFALLGGLFVLVPLSIGYITRKDQRKVFVKKYKADKVACVKKLIETLMINVDESFLKENVFDHCLKDMVGYIDQFCESTVPRRITSGEKLVKGIRKGLRQPIEVRKQCLQLEIKFRCVYGRVLYIHIDYFDMLTIKQSNIRKANTPNVYEVLTDGENWVETKVKRRKWSYDNDVDCCLLSDLYNLRTIKHVNILKCLGITFTSLKRGLLLDIHTRRCEKSLDTVIFHSTKESEPWITVKTYLCHSLQGLVHLHLHGLAHGNIKPTNILISDGIAKLSDVGIRRPHLKGSSGVLQSLFYGREVDIFQFGIVLWESWYRMSALDEDLPSSLEPYEQISDQILYGTKPEFQGKISKRFKSIIEDCWKNEPVNRPGGQNILERLQCII